MKRNQPGPHSGPHYGIVTPLPNSIRQWIEDWLLAAPPVGRRGPASHLGHLIIRETISPPVPMDHVLAILRAIGRVIPPFPVRVAGLSQVKRRESWALALTIEPNPALDQIRRALNGAFGDDSPVTPNRDSAPPPGLLLVENRRAEPVGPARAEVLEASLTGTFTVDRLQLVGPGPSLGRQELGLVWLADPARAEAPGLGPKRSLIRHAHGWRLASTPA